jgi:nicotinamide mononucleotide transporter
MNYNQLLEQTKQELFGGWKPFEAAWLLIFIAAQIGIYIYTNRSI